MTFQGTIFDAGELLPELKLVAPDSHQAKLLGRIDARESDWVLAWVEAPSHACWCILRYVLDHGWGWWIEEADEPLRMQQVNGVTHWAPLPPAPAKEA